MKEGVFICPEIGKIIRESQFKDFLSSTRKAAWLAFISIAANFHGNNKFPAYVKTVRKCVSTLGLMGCNMSLKISLPDLFPENLRVSDEYRERFHQGISEEPCSQGR
ncbi:hypothetical protein QYM36_009184 [Artemia franciscana]|uniref:Uncharacterized protein n=1 Tax=Artemia franciscana TaxID=6661 RepID=A0AA88I0M4_ARTSF|nr:hypothetical protein QYM36_009184 [Artemia franciscana]